ncbi:hypothetical protein D3C78_1301400 [compost metagenome]
MGFTHWHADQAAGITRHKVDVLSLHMLSRHDDITLVLAILIIDQHDHFTEADVFDDVFNFV